MLSSHTTNLLSSRFDLRHLETFHINGIMKSMAFVRMTEPEKPLYIRSKLTEFHHPSLPTPQIIVSAAFALSNSLSVG
jgi:hypothetical protein